MKSSVSGINIQFPWAALLLEGKKVIETRTYPLPEKFKGEILAVIETPGKYKSEVPQAKVIGLIVFKKSKKYLNKKEWIADYSKQLVKEGDPLYSWKEDKEKWGWEVEKTILFDSPIDPPKKRGIMYVNNCMIPQKYIDRISN